MSRCPQCDIEFDGWPERCPQCGGALVDGPRSGDPERTWPVVHRAPMPELRIVEARLRALGIPVVVLAEDRLEVLGPWNAGDLATRLLAVPPDQYDTRREEIEEAIAAATGAGEEQVAAILEAEEDYDVRGCPACAFFFHETYSTCPGCGETLVPAVECFVEGQMEPERVVVGHGDEAAVKRLEQALRAAGFAAEAWEVEGWAVGAVDMPWTELTDRTAEAEAVLRAERGAGEPDAAR